MFPPTDFHTASLVGDQIFIIGNLGYPSQRVEEITVYALHVPTLQISRITTSGDAPCQLFDHRATLIDGALIRIERGEFLRSSQKIPNHDIYYLDTNMMRWTRQ